MKQKYVIIAVLIVLAIGGGVYAWQKIQDPYRGWKTYRNDELGYSVKYPGYFEVKEIEITDSDRQSNPRLVEILKNSTFFKNKEKDLALFLEIYDNPLNLSPREWVHWAWEDNIVDEEAEEYYKDRIINGMKAIVAGSDIENEQNLGIVVKLTKKNHAFEALFSGYPENEERDQIIFNKFVKSLQVNE